MTPIFFRIENTLSGKGKILRQKSPIKEQLSTFEGKHLMYTNAGILETMTVGATALNLVIIQEAIEAVEAGQTQIPREDFLTLVRWEEDIRAHFLRKAEAIGLTNICRKDMGVY